MLFSVAFVISYVCYVQYNAESLHASLAHGAGATAVSVDYWTSLVPERMPRIGMFEAAKGYIGWKDFSGMVLAGSIIGMIGCIGGAGGRYGEQRFLAKAHMGENQPDPNTLR